MTVEVLSVAQCPSHPAAVRLVRDVLAAEGIAVEVREVIVTNEGMARRLGFLGSPSVRVDGRDVSGEGASEEGFSLRCRLYPGSGPLHLPPEEAVRQAVRQAYQGQRS